MKKLLIVLIAIAFVACSSGEKKAPESSSKNAEIVEASFNVCGMHCENCVASIKKGVNELEGIENITITLDDSTAVVKYDASQLAISDIEKAVEKRGFKVKK